jgi:hypothetical protein
MANATTTTVIKVKGKTKTMNAIKAKPNFLVLVNSRHNKAITTKVIISIAKLRGD